MATLSEYLDPVRDTDVHGTFHGGNGDVKRLRISGIARLRIHFFRACYRCQ